MERRVLLAIFLAFLVLFVWERVFRPAPKPAPVAGVTPAAGTPTASGGAATGAGGTTTSADKAPAAPAASTTTAPPVQAEASAAPLVADTAERDVTVETRDVIAVFTNRGARLK